MHDHHHDIKDVNEAKILLQYMYDHNCSHTDELVKLAHKLNAEGKTDVAEDLTKAIEFYKQGNDFLHSALEKAGE